MLKKRIGLIFGGVSTEHEISIITFDQVHKNIDRELYEPVPIYITQEGDWIADDRLKDVTRYGEIFTGKKSDLAKFNRSFIPPYPIRHDTGGLLQKLAGNKIKIDAAFPLIHGYLGEDGALQGLIEMADIPYVGAGIAGSAVGMDKVLQKRILSAAGLPVVKFRHYLKSRVEEEHEAVKKDIVNNLRFPIFVKPASAGSSVGVVKVASPEFVSAALDNACRFDRKVIVEEGVVSPREINCAVIGDDGEVLTSVCEEVFSKGFLDYEQKYMKGGKKGGGGMASVTRKVPADIDAATEKRIKDIASSVFRELDCSGLCRVDFLLDSNGNATVTELNSIPGSISFYLWEASGIPFKGLITKLIGYAESTYRRKKLLRRSSGFDAVKNYLSKQ